LPAISSHLAEAQFLVFLAGLPGFRLEYMGQCKDLPGSEVVQTRVLSLPDGIVKVELSSEVPLAVVGVMASNKS